MFRALTEPQQRQLLATAKAKACPLARRDYWWMKLMLATGIRVREFSLITAPAAEEALAFGWLVMPAKTRKGGKRGHEYLVTATVRECLLALLDMHRADAPAGCEDPAPPLLWGRAGKPLSVRSYQCRLKEWALAAGLGKYVSPHWMRHSRGLNIMSRSKSREPLKTVQAALGHVSIASSAVYGHMAREALVRDLHHVDGQRLSRSQAVRLANGGTR